MSKHMFLSTNLGPSVFETAPSTGRCGTHVVYYYRVHILMRAHAHFVRQARVQELEFLDIAVASAAAATAAVTGKDGGGQAAARGLDDQVKRIRKQLDSIG